MNALIFFLQYCVSKLTVLELLLKIALHASDEIILERLLPYMLFLVNDSLPQVRAQALKILSHCLQLVRSVPRSDIANIIISRVRLAKFIVAHSRSGELRIPCLLYTSPSPRDLSTSRMPSSA